MQFLLRLNPLGQRKLPILISLYRGCYALAVYALLLTLPM